MTTSEHKKSHAPNYSSVSLKTVSLSIGLAAPSRHITFKKPPKNPSAPVAALCDQTTQGRRTKAKTAKKTSPRHPPAHIKSNQDYTRRVIATYSAAATSPRGTFTPAPAISTAPVGLVRSKAFPSRDAIGGGRFSHRGQQGPTAAAITMWWHCRPSAVDGTRRGWPRALRQVVRPVVLRSALIAVTGATAAAAAVGAFGPVALPAPR